MTRVLSFLQLIRWPNLLFIALTQLLFQYCILLPITSHVAPVFNNKMLLLLITASVVIAAAGYIINDYFDINIDQINKPGRQIIGKQVNRRWAILWHSTLSFIGVAISFYIGYKLRIWWLGPANIICTFLLFVYSTTFKKRFLSGNIIISVLTAWTVAVLGLATFYKVHTTTDLYTGVDAARMLRFTILYSGFAFVSSLIREAVKDMEDIAGDAKYGCRTLPIVAGINAAKTYTEVWVVVLTGALLVVQFYALQFNWWITVIYSIVCIIIPLVYLFFKMFKAHTPKDFHRLSSLTKFIMLVGILSMVFFRIYI